MVMVRQVEKNGSRVQMWLSICAMLITIGGWVVPFGYNQLIEKGREMEKREQDRRTIEALTNELNTRKQQSPAAAPATAPADTETVTEKPKPKARQWAKGKGKKVTGQADKLPLMAIPTNASVGIKSAERERN
jgi:phage regulator Rha-like protein